jgi:hypothetical protein
VKTFEIMFSDLYRDSHGDQTSTTLQAQHHETSGAGSVFYNGTTSNRQIVASYGLGAVISVREVEAAAAVTPPGSQGPIQTGAANEGIQGGAQSPIGG